MSDLDRFTRLVEDGTEDSLLRDAFASARDDVPDAARRAATLAALPPNAVGEPGKANAPVTVPPTPNAPPDGGTEQASAGTGTGASTGTAAGGATLKWVVIVGLAAGALAVGLHASSGPVDAPSDTKALVSTPTSPPTPSAAATSPGSASIVAPPVPVAASSAEAPSDSARTAASTQPPRVPPTSSAKERAPLGLAEETAILDRARGALNRGDPRGALSELDRYDAAPAPKILGQEATMVRIEALSAKGDTTAARALAQSFLAKNPGSAYDDRVRALMAEPKKNP